MTSKEAILIARYKGAMRQGKSILAMLILRRLVEIRGAAATVRRA